MLYEFISEKDIDVLPNFHVTESALLFYLYATVKF